MGKTLAIIKPEAFERRAEVVMDVMDRFSIDDVRVQYWTREQIGKTYSKKRLNYGSQKANKEMSRLIPDVIFKEFGPQPQIQVLLLSSEGNTIEDLVRLCGPRDAMEYIKAEFKKTLRGRYGLRPSRSFVTDIGNIRCRFDFNGIHRASSQKELEEEMEIYF